MCKGCAVRCQLGCPHGIKWDSRCFLKVAQEQGAQVVTGCRVESVVIEGSRATGVRARSGWTRHFFPADLVVLAAGGLGTPIILDNSGIRCEPRLFVDPVLCVAARSPQSMQHKDVTMPFVSIQEHIILSPYFDRLSFLFDQGWRLRAGDIVSIMIKLVDEELGTVSRQGVEKALTDRDRRRLEEGVMICPEILLGGNVVTLGAEPFASPWRIGIQHPRQKSGIIWWFDNRTTTPGLDCIRQLFRGRPCYQETC